MKKIIALCLGILFCATSVWASSDIAGYWTTIDDETGDAKSVVQIYEHTGKYYGRVVDLLKNKQAVAEKLPNKPRILGLDIIWDLKADGSKFKGGEILDPQKGKVYGCEAWRDGDNLIVRGKIAFLGRNQTWRRNTEFVGDTTVPVPQKPKLN